MATNSVDKVMPHLRRTALRQSAADLPDAELLEQYATRQDEASFEALVHRHGSMVLGVCRRVLGNEADSEDAFQATFLVLVRKAASIRSRSTVSNWLYGVAYNTALKAKAMNRKRRTREREAGESPKREAAEEAWREVQDLLDTELSRLPDKYRVPIVLCELEGRTIREAALQLGWPQGTTATRLARGRALLARRLAKHGPILPGGVLTAALSHGTATASVPLRLVLATVKAAGQFATGSAATGAVSAPVAALTEGVLKAMLMTRLKIVTAVVLGIALLALSGVVYRTVAAEAPEEQKEVVKAPLKRPDAAGRDARKDDATGEEKINLPKSPALEQILINLDGNGKLVVKSAVTGYMHVVHKFPGGESSGVELRTIVRTDTFDLDDVRVLDTRAKKIDKKTLAKLLKGETVAMASFHGREVDPLHLRVFKESTLIVILPPPKAARGVLGDEDGVIPKAVAPAPAAPAPLGDEKDPDPARPASSPEEAKP